MARASLSKAAQWTSLLGTALWAALCLWLQLPLLIIPGLIWMIALPFLAERHEARRRSPLPGAELQDPFLAEVILDGEVVGTLGDRVRTDMFWCDYRITPASEASRPIIENDDLWEECRFTFRDPATQMTCATAFAGGCSPFIRDGVISLRAMYFAPSAPLEHS